MTGSPPLLGGDELAEDDPRVVGEGHQNAAAGTFTVYSARNTSLRVWKGCPWIVLPVRWIDGRRDRRCPGKSARPLCPARSRAGERCDVG